MLAAAATVGALILGARAPAWGGVTLLLFVALAALTAVLLAYRNFFTPAHQIVEIPAVEHQPRR